MELNYRHFGNGWPIIIAHGLYGSSDNWLSIAKMLEQHFSIYLLDLRNHGNSPHCPTHTYPDLANDIAEFAANHRIKSPIIIGHSMGGKAVMQLGLQQPTLPHKMIVVDISPLGNSQTHHKHLIYNHQSIISALRNLPIDSLESRKDADILLSERVPSDQVRNFLLKNLARGKGGFTWKLNLDVLAKELESIMMGFAIDNTQLHNQKEFPILFIRGDQSEYINEEDLKAIELFYPNAIVKTVEGAGHWVHAEKAEDFVRIIREFCSDEADFI